MIEAENMLVATAVALDHCMESLEKRDYDLKFSGKFKKCYYYLAEQFSLRYVRVKDTPTLIDLLDEIAADKFYNTWLVFLGIVKNFVKDGRNFHGIEDLINNSGISRKTWIKFLDYYFSKR